MRNQQRLSLVFAFVCCWAVGEATAETAVTYSPDYNVDRIYESMRGPLEERTGYYLSDGDAKQVLWITGFRAEAVNADSGEAAPQEFVCHNTLSFNYRTRTQALAESLIPASHRASQRLFTISQGQQEVRFPSGFGIPVLSNEPLMLQSQLLNLNEQSEPLVIRHKSQTFFTRQAELKQQMVPLFMVELIGAVPLAESAAGEAAYEHEGGGGCLSASTASESFNYTDHHGRRVSAHWLVPPGRHTYENYTGTLGINEDTTAHYFLAHLHPFAESLELIDATSGKSVFKSEVENLVTSRDSGAWPIWRAGRECRFTGTTSTA